MTEEQTRIKELFGMLLDAEDDATTGQSGTSRKEANSALGAAPPHVREAVDRLIKAHQRASGVLLEESQENVRSRNGDAAEIEVPPLKKPQIAGYKVGEELGRGGFGVVYRARQLHPVERKVAVKILRTELATQEAVSRFRAESRMLARMNHSGVARVLDAGMDEDHRPFVAMELIEGLPITAFCEQAGLSVRQRVRLMAEVCHAVHHAHQRMVIHRDLKPANILVEAVDGKPRPRVIDFGIAKIIEDGALDSNTMTGARLGTPKYMSPEQAEGTVCDDVRTDVYALGVVLCEVLTGSVPRDTAPSAPGSGSRHTTKATRPSQLAAKNEAAGRSSELRGDLDRIVLKAVALEPELRYESASALAEDLERYLDGRPVLATPPSAMYLTRKFIARRKAASAAIVLATVSMIGGTVAATYGLNRATQSEREAVSQQRRAEQEAAVAKEINDFWTDIIHRGSPREARRPDLQVREALDLAAPRLAEQIGDVLVRRRLHETFADAYHALGMAGPQLHHAQQAHALWESSADDDPVEAVQIQLKLGRALLEANDLDGARDSLLAAQSICESAGDAVRRHLPEVLQTLARVATANGEFAEAERIMIEAVAQSQEMFGPRHPVTLSTQEKLGLALIKVGRNQEVVDRLVPVLETQREVLGADHPDTIATLTVLANARENLGRYDEAERDFQVLLTQSVQTLGEEHSHILMLKGNLANLLSKLRRFDESEALFREVRDAYLRTAGADHPNTLTVSANLSILLTSQQKYDEAEAVLIEVIDGRTRVLGPEHPLTLNVEQGLATVYYYTGRHEEAASRYAQVLERLRRTVPAGAIHLAPVLRNYAATLRELGRVDESLPLFIESYEILQKTAGPDHPETHRGREFICETLARVDESDGFSEWHERCSE